MLSVLPGSVLQFDDFELDCGQFELRRKGQSLRVERKPMELLILLASRQGQLVTRAEIAERLWSNEVFVDTEHGINTAIRKLRHLLRDDPENPHFIQTVTGMGYRFVAPITTIGPSSPEGGDSTPPQPSPKLEPAIPVPASVAEPTRQPSAIGQSEEALPTTQRRWKIWSVGVSVALLASLLLYLNTDKLRHRFLPMPTPIQSIAVLPLENLSGDPTQDYFADGMTDALTTNLGKIGHLRVISRTSTMRYKGTKESLQQIAQELEVDGLVEGSVARSGDRVRITASLVQVAPEKHLWADTFESNLRDVLNLQDDASRAIANAIQIKLSSEEQARLTNSHPVNPQAYDAYLQGQFFKERFLPADGTKATEYFQLAIRNDPAWALPYSGLAQIHMVQGGNLPIPNEKCTGAKDEALEALKRDAESPEAHSIFADVEFFCEWNWADAEREVERAIELNPNLAEAHSSRGRYLLAMGKKVEALEETRRAVELDPLSFRIRHDRWSSLYLTGRYDEALEQCKKIQELDPTLDLGHLYCGDVYVQKGNLTEAVKEFEKAVDLTAGKNPRPIAHLAYGYTLAGRQNDAQKLLPELIDISKRRHVHPYLIALVYVGLGQKETAFEWLERAYQVHGRDLLDVRNDPQFAVLHTDPRFNSLIRRIGLPSL